VSRSRISLEQGKVYRWDVAVVHDTKRRSDDLWAEGLIEWARISSSLVCSLRETRVSFAPYELWGIWYDATSELQTAIGKGPDARRLLLEQACFRARLSMRGRPQRECEHEAEGR
jgi:hypothetical protein